MLTRWTRLGAVGALALGGFLLADPFGASSGAQSAPPVTIPFVGVDAAPDLSDDGSVVVFASTDPTGVSSIVVHDRIAGTTAPIAGSDGGQDPAVSGDGCTVGWSVPATPDSQLVQPEPAPAAGTTTTPTIDSDPYVVEPAAFQTAGGDPALFVANRCGDVETVTELTPTTPVADIGLPAISVDGGVVVVSGGTEVLRFDRTVTGYAQTATFAPPPQNPLAEIAPSVDLSDDGSVTVFAAGPDLDASGGLTVYRVDRVDGVDNVSIVASSAQEPSVSGSGSVVAYTAVVAEPPSATVTIREEAGVPVALGPGRRPVISGDGNHVVYETGIAVQVTSWTGDGLGAFKTTDTLTLTGPVAPTRSGPSVDRHASTVASDETASADVDTDTDITLNVIAADAGFESDTYRLGTGDVGAELSTTVAFTNAGPASLGVASVSVDGTFSVLAETCSPAVRPGATCTIRVGFSVEFLEEAFGTVSLVPVLAVADPAAFTTQVRASGQAPPDETPSSPATTTPGSTTGGATGRTTTGGSRTTSGGSRTTSTGGSRTTSSTGGRTTTTTTTVPPGAVAFSPTSFEFAPTIIDAGRRTGLVEIVNTTTSAVTVVGVRLEPADGSGFEIVETDCAGEAVPAGGRCSVTLAFAPDSTGDQAVQLIASLDAGTELSAAITGLGAAPPTLTVLPEVATTGQVVTVRGAGFPTGLTVELSWTGDTQDVVVDETGGFAIPVVVMTHTRRGQQTASVAGQTDQFGDVTARMLVTVTTDRSQPGVLDGMGPNIAR